MKPGHLLILALIIPAFAWGDIYKSVDENGHVTYSSEPLKGGKRIHLEPLPTMLPQGRSNTPEDFPRVDRETQRSRDDTRYMILQNELTEEEKLLQEAKDNLQDGEANPEVYKGKDGRTYRNMAKYDEKIKSLTEKVELHQKNVDALKTELSKLK
jgi:hypothetical protein